MKRGSLVGMLLAAMVGCAPILVFLDPGEPLPTVDGPEDPGLAERLEGWVVWAEGDAGDIRWLELPSRTRGSLTIRHDVSVLLGVDPQRRLLYIDTKDGIGRLRRASLDGGRKETLHEFSHGLQEAWADPGLRWLIHPQGWTLCTLDLEHADDASVSKGTRAEDYTGRARWLVPGEGLVYESFVPVWARDDPDTRFRDALVVLDLKTGDERTLAREGRELCAVDSGSGEILVTVGDPQDGDLRLQRYDASWNLLEDDVRVPGLLFGILAVSHDGLVVYEGLPTTGTEQELLGFGLTWPRARWTLKVADPRTGAFETLLPSFEHRYGLPEPIASLRPAH